MNKLEEIAELFASVLPSPLKRERLANAIEQEQYIKKLLNLFHICEDLETEEGLHHLYEIFKAIFILNKNTLFEIMFVEENILDVLGVLEYDPNVKETVKHRQFVQEKARFKEVVPITSKELLQKIHQTYKVQYIQDILVPVPTVFEDNMSTLSSYIFFSKIEIVNMIQVRFSCYFYDTLALKISHYAQENGKVTWPTKVLFLSAANKLLKHGPRFFQKQLLYKEKSKFKPIKIRVLKLSLVH